MARALVCAELCNAASPLYPLSWATGPRSGLTSTTADELVAGAAGGARLRNGGETSKATAFENFGVGDLMFFGGLCEKARVTTKVIRNASSVKNIKSPTPKFSNAVALDV